MSVRMLTVWFPDWPVTAAGFGPDQVAAVMFANRVVARTSAAAAEGVVIGQRRRQAQRRCPDIELIDHDPTRDARAFEPVVRAVAEVSPRLDLIEPGWLTMAARGPSKYFGGDAAVAAHLHETVATGVAETVAADVGAGVDVGVGVGVADGRFASSVAARLAVRRRHSVLVDAGGSTAFCAPLPIGWLQTLGESDPEMVELFVRLGLRRLGDLAALEPADVLGRFGHPGVHAHRLASGADVRLPSTTDPAPERRLDQVLDDPVAQASAAIFVAKQLADELTQALGAAGRVCTRLVVELETEYGERSERAWYRSAGLNAAAMVERVRWQLDAWIDLPRGSDQEITGGISLIRLTPDEVCADVGVQLGLWGGQSDADRRAARTIARLTTITSDAAVTVPVWNGGRLPADRYRWVPASNVDLDHPVRAVSSAGTGSGPSGPWPGALPAPSPATVFADPHPAEVLDDAGRPVQVNGRGAVSAPPAGFRLLSGDEERGWRRGRVRDITAWAGPWPVDERWWEPGGHRRLARFQVVASGGGDGGDGDGDGDGGQRGYLVVAEHRRWWVAALYD